MDKYDVVIVGGGVVGICAAYFLHQQGKSVAVLDKGEIGGACSWGNAGYITPSHIIPLAAPGMIAQGIKWLFHSQSPFTIKPKLELDFATWLIHFFRHCTKRHIDNSKHLLLDLHQQSLALYQNFHQLLSDNNAYNFELFHNGLLFLYKHEAALKTETERVAMARDLGLNARMVEPQQVAEMEPQLKFDIRGGAYYPEDAHTLPFRFVQGLRNFLAEQSGSGGGVKFFEKMTVTEFKHNRGRIDEVVTTHKRVRCDELVIAAGAWSAALGRTLGLKIPVQSGKGYSFFQSGGDYPCRTPFILEEARVAVTPMCDNIRFAGTLELGNMDPAVNPHRVKGILNGIKSFLPDFKPEKVKLDQVWSGFRPCSPDGIPIIGRHPAFDNLTLATGHAMMGMSLGPISGKLVAEIISGLSPSVPLAAMATNRFN